MASNSKYARRRRNAFLAALVLALVFIIIVIVIIVSIAKRSSSTGGNVPTATPTNNSGALLPTPNTNTDVTPSPDNGTSIIGSPSPSASNGSSNNNTTGGTVMYVTASSVNVRKSASASSEKVTSLTNGTSVTAYEESNGFYRVKLSNGQTGYIAKQYLSTSASTKTATPAPAATPDTSKSKTVYAKTDVRVRDSAGTTGKVLTTVKKDTKLTAYSEKNGWTYVQYANGKYGYISTTYLTDAPSGTTNAPTPSPTAKPATASNWTDVGLPADWVSNFGTSTTTQGNYLNKTPKDQSAQEGTGLAKPYYILKDLSGNKYYLAKSGDKVYIYTSLDNIISDTRVQ